MSAGRASGEGEAGDRPGWWRTLIRLGRPGPAPAAEEPAGPLQPAAEPERLLVLNASGLLHAVPDPRLLPLLREAARLFDLPVAAVSLIDRDWQRVRAATGIEPLLLPRDVSPCASTILDADQALVIEDLASRDRFRANPLVAGAPGLRFYAGVPLLTAAGQAMGTFSLADTRPRALTPGSFARLTELAARGAALMRLRTGLGEHQRHRPRSGGVERDAGLERAVQGAAAAISAAATRDGAALAATIDAVLGDWAREAGRLSETYRHRVHTLCSLLHHLAQRSRRAEHAAAIDAARHAVLAAA